MRNIGRVHVPLTHCGPLLPRFSFVDGVFIVVNVSLSQVGTCPVVCIPTQELNSCCLVMVSKLIFALVVHLIGRILLYASD